MSVAPFSIVAGPAAVYIAAAGAATYPVTGTIANFDSSGGLEKDFTAQSWTYLGRTEGGVAVQHQQEVKLLGVDQSLYSVKAIRTSIMNRVTFQLADMSLASYTKALYNNSVTTPSANIRQIQLGADVDVTLFMMLVRAPSSQGNGFMHYELPVVITMGSPETRYVRDDKATLACEYVSLEDTSQSVAANKMGRLVAYNATA